MNKVQNKEAGRMRFWSVAWLIVLLFAGAGCSRRRYPLQGEVVAKSVATGEITVRHGDIPGFMDAMTMPYRVKNPAILQELEPGDKIAADVVIGSDRSDYWLEDVRITDESGRVSAKPALTPTMLMPGERVPNVPLVNQDGRTIHLSDFTGKAVLVTFIYTRCPMPDFCPRLTSEFAHIEKQLAKNPDESAKTHLLTISFDPKYDTPAVLRKYALAYLDNNAAAFAHWDFATAKPDDLARLAKAFGLQYQEQSDQIIHTMNIALIAPDGTLARFWSTNWTPEELLASLRHAANPSSGAGGS